VALPPPDPPVFLDVLVVDFLSTLLLRERLFSQRLLRRALCALEVF